VCIDLYIGEIELEADGKLGTRDRFADNRSRVRFQLFSLLSLFPAWIDYS